MADRIGIARQWFLDCAVVETALQWGRQCGSQRLAAGGRWIRTLGPPVRDSIFSRPPRTLVALAQALDHPDAVSSLVLVSGYYHPTLRADVPLFSLPAIPVIGDLIRYIVGRGVPALDSEGHVLAASRARTLCQRLLLRNALTAMADSRRSSGYRRNGFGSGCNAAPLSGTADARCDRGRNKRPRPRSSAKRGPGSARDSAQHVAARSGCWTHGPLCRARASRRRDRGFWR